MILEERNRLAREIHDGIAQVLAGVIFQLESALRQSADQSGNMEQVVEQKYKKITEEFRGNSLFYLCFKTVSYPKARVKTSNCK